MRLQLTPNPDALNRIVTETLAELIPAYGEKNTECNALKKVVADLNSKIKQVIKDEAKENTAIEIDGWKCTLTVTDEAQVNEDKLVEVLKKYDIPAVKTKEYVDADALEKLTYAGKLSEEVMLAIERCTTTTKKEVLRCTKAK